jgi:peptide/nickel transport system substrate-binding protein
MPIRIYMSGPDSERELASLYAWLGEEWSVRQHARMSMAAPEPGPSDMGAAFDVIQLVVDSGFQAANFALAYAAWRSTRAAHPKVTIEIDGARNVEVEGTDADATEAIVRFLEQEAGMAEVANPLRSRAVLIGTGRYKKLNPIVAVRNNLPALAEMLCADRVWGLPAERCVIVEDPGTTADMLDPVVMAAQDATDTLLVYYAGHGLVDSRRSELHLALTASDPERIYTSVPYSLVRDALLDSRAVRRIVILDCCFSGRALGQMGGPASAVVDEASAEGTFVLAASPENRAALAPPGEQYTAFTAELLTIIRSGIAECGPVLDLDSVYKHLLEVMRSKGLPLPQKRDRNTAGELSLFRNQAYLPIADLPENGGAAADGMSAGQTGLRQHNPTTMPAEAVVMAVGRNAAGISVLSDLSASATPDAPVFKPIGSEPRDRSGLQPSRRPIPLRPVAQYLHRHRVLSWAAFILGFFTCVLLLFNGFAPSQGRGDNPTAAVLGCLGLGLWILLAIYLRLISSNGTALDEQSSSRKTRTTPGDLGARFRS